MYKLWLDDIRNPEEWLGINYFNSDWVWCLDFQTAKMIVETQGFPCFVAFDHDLGLCSEGSGLDFANWLVDYDLETNKMPVDFDFSVHSANPCGAKNIEGLMRGYLDFKKENPRE